MKFDNIHYTQQQVRGGHFGSRNNVLIEQKNIIMQGPTPPKMNFWQGLLTGLTGGGFGGMFGGFGMPGMFGGCGMGGSIFGGGFGMPGMFGGCGMGSIFGGFGNWFGGFGMGGMSPFGMGSYGVLGQGAATPALQDSGNSLEASTKQLKNLFGARYNIEYISDGDKVVITDKSGNEVYSGSSIDDAQKAMESRNGKLDQETAAAAKKNAAIERENMVEVDGKYYKKDDAEHKTEYRYDSTADTFKQVATTAHKPQESEAET